MGNRAGETLMCCFVGCTVTTFVTYVIGMSLSWVYTKALFPENEVGRAAAIIITIPVFTVFLSIFVAILCQMDKKVQACGCLCSVTSIILSALFDVIGVILLIVSMVQASKDLASPAGPIVCGTFAAFFVTASAISNCLTCGSLGAFEQKDKTYDNLGD